MGFGRGGRQLKAKPNRKLISRARRAAAKLAEREKRKEERKEERKEKKKVLREQNDQNNDDVVVTSDDSSASTLPEERFKSMAFQPDHFQIRTYIAVSFLKRFNAPHRRYWGRYSRTLADETGLTPGTVQRIFQRIVDGDKDPIRRRPGGGRKKKVPTENSEAVVPAPPTAAARGRDGAAVLDVGMPSMPETIVCESIDKI